MKITDREIPESIFSDSHDPLTLPDLPMEKVNIIPLLLSKYSSHGWHNGMILPNSSASHDWYERWHYLSRKKKIAAASPNRAEINEKIPSIAEKSTVICAALSDIR